MTFGLSRRSPRRVAVRRDLVVHLSGRGMHPAEILERVRDAFDPATKLSAIYNDLRVLRSQGRIAPAGRVGAPRQHAVTARRELISDMLEMRLRPRDMLEHVRREINPAIKITAIYGDIYLITQLGPADRNGRCRE